MLDLVQLVSGILPRSIRKLTERIQRIAEKLNWFDVHWENIQKLVFSAVGLRPPQIRLLVWHRIAKPQDFAPQSPLPHPPAR